MSARPELSYSIAIDYFIASNPGCISHAYREFLALVDPDVDEDDEQAEDLLHSLCLEWFLFDFKLENGKTPLEHLVADAPESISEKALDEFRQSAETHFSSTFLVAGAHPALSLVTLEDLSTGQRYPVTDTSLSRGLPDGGGIIGARLVNVDGAWYFPGNPVFFLPVVPTDRMLKMIREDANPKEEFIDLVRSHFGRKGDGEDAPFEMARAPQSAEERRALLEELEGRYAALAASEKLKPAWSDVANAIRTEDGKTAPGEVLLSLFSDDGEEIGIDDMDALEELVSIFLNAWNNLPHDSLGGKCPSKP